MLSRLGRRVASMARPAWLCRLSNDAECVSFLGLSDDWYCCCCCCCCANVVLLALRRCRE